MPGSSSTAAIIGPTRLRRPRSSAHILAARESRRLAACKLGDVARVELGAENYLRDIKYNGKPGAGMAIRLATGANALDTVDGDPQDARPAVAVLSRPASKAVYPFDTTPFVRISIEEVVQDAARGDRAGLPRDVPVPAELRATLIPTIAVPVVLLGTFGVLAALGYSINTLTMFGMVLSIGLLVDDAIVVVENVERLMREERPVAAGRDAQVDGPDHRRAGRHRARARGGVPADGVLRRLDRRHLPPVLDHDGVARWCCRCSSR